MKRITGFLIMVLTAGCGSGEDAPATGAGEAAASPDTVYITAADTIGSEMGETPDVFAFIVDAAHTPDGNIAVLDAGRGNLQVFSPDGELLNSIGRKGPGPGEYQMPIGLAVTDVGFVVSDIAGAKLVHYDAAGEYSSEVTGFFPIPPARLTGTVDGRFVAADIFVDIEGEDGPTASMDFVAFAEGSEPETVFRSYTSGGTAMINSNEFADLGFAAGPAGEAYLVERSDSAFVLQGFTAGGTEFLLIEEEHERIPLTEEELEQDEMAISLTVENGETNLATERRPITSTHRNIIESVGVDGEGNIWVEMSDRLETCFRVYSPEGELLHIAIPDETIQDGTNYAITPWGMLAYDGDPDDWPKLYLLEVL